MIMAEGEHNQQRRHYFNASTATATIDYDVDEEGIEQIVLRMRQKETTLYHNNCKERRDIAHNELVALWRRMLVEWMYCVVECCHLQQHSVAVAVYFLDVAILRGMCKSREEHQLAAATALQMSLKTFDTAVIKLDKLVKLGRGQFTENEVTDMEMKIITCLNWHLHPPTIYCFLRQYELLIPTEITDSTRKLIDDVTRLIAEESILDERFIRFPPSYQGYSAILVALDLIPDENFPDHLKNHFTTHMLTVAKIDSNSTPILKLKKRFHKTLKRSNKLQEIAANTNNTNVRNRILNDVKNCSKNSRDGIKGTQHHSPRDVKGQI